MVDSPDRDISCSHVVPLYVCRSSLVYIMPGCFLHATNWPLYFSTATKAQGVKETFVTLLKLVYQDMERRFNLKTEHGLGESDFIMSVISSTEK